jgi:phenylalanine-4-hydroxylase
MLFGCVAVMYREDEVPQLQDISDTLKASTGWQVGYST